MTETSQEWRILHSLIPVSLSRFGMNCDYGCKEQCMLLRFLSVSIFKCII